MNTQNHSKSQNQNVPQQTSQSVIFNDQPQATLDYSKNYPFFQQHINITDKHHFRNQPHYSEDEEYYPQIEQGSNANQQNDNWNIDQPDLSINQIFSNIYTK